MPRFELLLFSADPQLVGATVSAGVDGVVVDCELRGKGERQIGAGTQIVPHTIDDLRCIRACTDRTVICRTDGFSDTIAAQIELTIEADADEILLPMVRSAGEVKDVLAIIDDRCALGIMLETRDALDAADELARLPLKRIYVGLNDLAIELDVPNIFTPIADGTIERIREIFPQPFGFGGITLPDRGSPIPSRLLMGELARLACDFTVLRRSFLADVAGRDVGVEIGRMRAAVSAAFQRPPGIAAKEHDEFCTRVRVWNPRRP